MSIAHLNAVVRLTHDVPMHWLHRGDVGVVRSIWLSPTDCYEVEFCRPGVSIVRALVNCEQLEVLASDAARAGAQEPRN